MPRGPDRAARSCTNHHDPYSRLLEVCQGSDQFLHQSLAQSIAFGWLVEGQGANGIRVFRKNEHRIAPFNYNLLSSNYSISNYIIYFSLAARQGEMAGFPGPAHHTCPLASNAAAHR